MNNIARRSQISSLLAPIILIGGWTIAEASWHSYEPMRQTISELAAGDAPTRTFMTIVFILTGVCHIVTASGLNIAHKRGRIMLAIGGAATIAVAFAPLPSVLEHSPAHTTFATISFGAMSLWPALAMRTDITGSWMVSQRGAIIGTLILGALSLVFLATWLTESNYAGLAERMLAGSQAFWPWGLVRDVTKNIKD